MRRLRRLSISGRITIGSLILAALLGLIAVLVVRVGVSSILHNATVTLLNNDAGPYVTALENNPSSQPDEPIEGQLLAIVNPHGALIESTLTKSLMPHVHELSNLGSGAHSVQTGQASYLVMTKEVPTSAGTFKVITARNDETANLILGRLTNAMLIGALILIACFGIASYVLARTALRPVSRMRREAEVIAERSSTGLLPVGPAQDELAALAVTLNDLIARLRASADREKQLVSDASHELRTPLAVLQGQLELAELNAGNPDALLADVRSSHATVLRLSALATNLLELSRIESPEEMGRSDWRTLTAELADAIDRARLLVAPEAAVSIDFDFSPRQTRRGTSGTSGAARFALSGADFARILDNLLSNAISAVGSSGTITVDLRLDEEMMHLVVSDTGAGMPLDFIPVAFDRFTRADASRSAHSGGGLGLSIVAAIVTAAGGSITLTNAEAPETGLRVGIDLPIESMVVPSAGPQVGRATDPSTRSGAGAGIVPTADVPARRATDDPHEIATARTRSRTNPGPS